jgi:hypothetical protein
MQNVAADLAQMLGVERVLWEQEHLVTYGFDGTAALYGEAGCVALPKTTEEVSQVVRYAAKYRIPVGHPRLRYRPKRGQRAGTRLHCALPRTDGSGPRT